MATSEVYTDDALFERRMEMTQWCAGRALSEDDVADLKRLMDELEEETERAADSFAVGERSGRDEAGGAEVTRLLERIDALDSCLCIERSMARFWKKLAGQYLVSRRDLLELLQAAAEFVEDEAENRSAAGSVYSDYEREPRELAERLRAAIAKQTEAA